jgi:hypothetical protein
VLPTKNPAAKLVTGLTPQVIQALRLQKIAFGFHVSENHPTK